MSRKSFINIACCLLCLLPTLSIAQSLQRIEYWFDDDFSSRSIISLSGSEDAVTKLLSTDGMDNGVHKFSFRVRRSDGKYSAISSSLFFKQNDGAGEKLEYWLDNDYDHRVSMDMSATEAEQELTLDLHDMEWCPIGFHQLHIRVSAEGKGMSSVYTTGIWKCPLGNATQIEYWFDNDMENSQVLSGHLSSDGKGYIINTDLDVSQLSIGMHRLNYRACDKENQFYGAVQSDIFLKVPSGKASILEYWLDDNLGTRKQFSGSTTTGGYMFTKDLDLGNVSPGHHRLSVRAKSSDGKLVTAVTSMPIIVKSRYNVDMADAEALTVTEHSYWFDNEEPDVASVSNPRNIITQPYTLDTRKLSDGQHTLHVQYGNSAGIWNGPVDYTFTKTHVNAPMIAANVTVEDGVVTLKYTAIPFGQRYIVVRQYPSGTKRKVDDLKNTEYPAALQATDTPAPGTYTYYIEGIYTDADGQTQKVRSGDMTVTVEHAARTVEKSNIYGIVTVDGERFEDRFPIYESYDITVNGQPINKSSYNYRRRDKGVFVIEDVPHGTELTIGIEYKTYSFNEIKLVVNENTDQKTYRFNCDSGDVHEEQLDNDAFDLDLWNPIALTPDAWEVGVHNKYKYTAWSGDIIVKAISKRVMDLYDREAEEGVSLWYYLRHSNAGLDGGPNYKTVASTHVYLNGGEYKTLPLDIIDIPKGYDEDDREFYVCIFSKKDDTDEVKPLAGGQRQTLSFNPLDYAPSGYIDDYLISEYKEVLRLLKRMKDWGDPFGFEINTLGGNNLERIITNLGNGTYDIEGLKQDIIVNASNGAGLLLDCFIDDVNNNIVEDVRRNGKEILGRFRISEGIREVCNTLESFYHLNEVDDNHKFLETFKLVMQVSDRLKNSAGIKYPAFEVYKSYFDLADAMISTIENYELTVQGASFYEKLINGKGVYKIKVRRYTSDGSVQYFSSGEVWEQIRSVQFMMTTDQSSFEPKSTSAPEDLSDYREVAFRNVEFDKKGSPNLSTEVQVWMVITWKNNRVTRIPMLDKQFAKLSGFDGDTPTMSVEFQSATSIVKERMANKLTIIKQK